MHLNLVLAMDGAQHIQYSLLWTNSQRKTKKLQSLITSSFADITKFWTVPTHIDSGFKNQYFVMVPANDFIFLLNGAEYPVKVGRAYAFNQNKKHSAHNNGKTFICATFPIEQRRLKKFLDANNRPS